MSKQSTPIFALTVIAAEALTTARFVTPTGAVPSGGGNTLGVTLSDAASGALVPIGVLGTVVVEAGAAITKGDTLKVGTAGKAITWATSGAKVAIALQAAGADGDFIEALLIPNAA